MASGRFHRLNATEIARVRDLWRRVGEIRNERARVLSELRLSREAFCRIGSGKLGKKPRAA